MLQSRTSLSARPGWSDGIALIGVGEMPPTPLELHRAYLRRQSDLRGMAPKLADRLASNG